MQSMDYVWLMVTIAAAIAEAATSALVSVWFVPGGIAALLASLFGGPLWLQIVLFLAVSSLALVLTRPLAKKFQNREKAPTNADMVLGRTAVVTEKIDNVRGTGRVSVLGNSWAARSSERDGVIPQETEVQVERIEGVKLIVSPAGEKGKCE